MEYLPPSPHPKLLSVWKNPGFAPPPQPLTNYPQLDSLDSKQTVKNLKSEFSL